MLILLHHLQSWVPRAVATHGLQFLLFALDAAHGCKQ